MTMVHCTSMLFCKMHHTCLTFNMISTSAAYPFGIHASVLLPLLPRWIEIAGRPESAPPLFLYNDHPWKPCQGVHEVKCYLMLVDNSKPAADAISHRKEWSLLQGTVSDAQAQGK